MSRIALHIFYQTQVWLTIAISVAFHIIAGVLAVFWCQSTVIEEVRPWIYSTIAEGHSATGGF